MLHPFRQKPSQVVFWQGEHEIHAFLPSRAQPPLTQCVGLGTLGRRFEDPESKMVDVLVELLGENAVAVMQQEVVVVIRWYGFAPLLERP